MRTGADTAYRLLRKMLRNVLHNTVYTVHMEQQVRKITRVGKRSLAVVLPADLVRELGWKEKQKVVVKKRGKGFIVVDWKK